VRRSRIKAWPLLALTLAVAAGPAAAACKLQKLAELPVTMAGPLKAVAPAKINGAEVRLIIDSGATMGGLTQASAAQLGVSSHALPGRMQIRGTNGDVGDFAVGTVKDLELAGGLFHDVDFLIGGRIPNIGAAGRLGQNLFGAAVTEYDIGGAAVRLFRAQDCNDAGFAYWAAPDAVSVMALEAGAPTRQIMGDVQVNGHMVHAMFDTGAPSSVLTKAAALRVGIDLSPAAVTAGPGLRSFVAGEPQATYRAHAASFRIGKDEAHDLTLDVVEGRLGQHDMLIGMDFFLAHRVIVDRQHNRLYFTANHGELFAKPAQPPTAGEAAP
jgi:predicted aspartyl protease